MLLFQNLYLSIFSFVWYDYGDWFIRPVRTIEKMCARLVRETQFILSAVISGSQVLKLVRWLISFINIDATLWQYHIANWEIVPRFCPYWSWCHMSTWQIKFEYEIMTRQRFLTKCHTLKASPWSTRLTWPATRTFPLTAHAPRKRSIGCFSKKLSGQYVQTHTCNVKK